MSCGNGNDPVGPEVDQSLGDAVALGHATVLSDQEAVVDAPALIARPQSP